MLSFIESLKDLISQVKANGGNPLQKLSAPAEVVVQLKAYAVTQLRQYPENLSEEASSSFSEDFIDGFFEEGLRAALIYLNEIGISDSTEVIGILKQVIDRRVHRLLQPNYRERLSYGHPRREENLKIDDVIVESVHYVWDERGSEQTKLYSYAKQHFLISWNYGKNTWKPTNLGEFLLDLNPLQASNFLLTVDCTVSTGDYDFNHVSRERLTELRTERPMHILPTHSEILSRLGILRTSNLTWYPEEITPLGETAIEWTISDSNPMAAVVIALMENEEKGISFQGSDRELDALSEQLKSHNMEIGSSIQNSIESGINLYKNGDYVNAARIFFPSVESVANQMLQIAGENVSDHREFPGLAKKVAKLEALNMIPTDLSKGIEITVSRNKILHGEFDPLEKEYAYPICVAVIMYLRRLINAWIRLKNQ